jgi:hypothetical protein
VRGIQLIGGRWWIFADRDGSATPGNRRNQGVQSENSNPIRIEPGSVIPISCTHAAALCSSGARGIVAIHNLARLASQLFDGQNQLFGDE